MTTLATPKLEHGFGHASVRGSRANQEDRIVALRLGDALCVALADGVGGRPNGHLAATAATKAAVSVLSSSVAQQTVIDLLPNALQVADQAVAEIGKFQGEKPGTAFILAVFQDRALNFVSVGDSHLIRLRNGELHFLTTRHQSGVDAEISALLSGHATDWHRVANMGQPKALTMALVGEGLYDQHVARTDVREGDIYLFATDGIESLSFDALARAIPVIAKRLPTAEAIAQRVLHGVRDLDRPNQDNATLGVVTCFETAAHGATEETHLTQP